VITKGKQLDTRHVTYIVNIWTYGHHYTQVKANNINKTPAVLQLQTTGGKDEPYIVFMGEIVAEITTRI